jgi:branched-chain amino acid transport system substrate-binding protein
MLSRTLLGLFSSFIFLAGLLPEARAQNGRIKVATQSPLSGEQAALGEHIKLGAQLAVEEAAKRSGSATICLSPWTIRRNRKRHRQRPERRPDPDVLLVVGHLTRRHLPAQTFTKNRATMISPVTRDQITDRAFPTSTACGRDDVQVRWAPDSPPKN